IKKIVIKNNPEVFITLFGPTYFHPGNTKHIVGFAQGWLIYDNESSLSLMKLKDRIKRVLLNQIQTFFFKRNSDAFIVETKDVKNKIINKFNISDERVFVNSNTVSANFINFDNSKREKKIVDGYSFKDGDIKLLTVAYPYPHKNLGVINELIRILPRHYKFIVTIPPDIFPSIFPNYSEQIINIGSVSNSDCPALYDFCDAVFLPSLIECFSCNYAEAFFSKKPLFTSNLSFATSTCGNAAFYFNPTDVEDIARTIFEAYENPDKIENKVLCGYNKSMTFPSPKQRALSLLDFAKSFSK
ncbi:glycosyltransferase, partial [Yersinia ruckeri]